MSKHFDLETFTFNGHTLRTVNLDGKTWFPSADMARCLNMRTDIVATGVRRLDDPSGLMVVSKAEHGGDHQLGGLFSASASRAMLVEQSLLLLFLLRAQRSNPAAKDFQDWITKVVIPSIRKDGGGDYDTAPERTNCPLALGRTNYDTAQERGPLYIP